MKKTVLILAALLLLSSPALAQHPCDTTPVSVATVTVGQPFTVGACYNNRDKDGLPVVGTVSYRLYRNGVLIPGNPTTIGSTPNAQGKILITWTRTEIATASSVQYAATTFTVCPPLMNGCGESTIVNFPPVSAVGAVALPAPMTDPRVSQP